MASSEFGNSQGSAELLYGNNDDASAFRAIQGIVLDRLDVRIQDMSELLEAAQQSILQRLLRGRKIRALVNSIASAQKAKERIGSENFLDQLSRWGPWRLSIHSIEAGKNLEVNASRAYSGKDFHEWVKSEAERKGVSVDLIYANIIEGIRRVEWETLKVLLAKGETNNTRLPINLISNSPNADALYFDRAWKRARRIKNPDALFDRELARKETGFGMLAAFPYEVQHILGQASAHSTLPLSPYYVMAATNQDKFVYYDSRLVSRAILDARNGNTRWLNQLVENVSHEATHVFWKGKGELVERKKADLDRNSSPLEDFESGLKAEQETGFEQLVQDVSHRIRQRFEPVEFFRKII